MSTLFHKFSKLQDFLGVELRQNLSFASPLGITNLSQTPGLRGLTPFRLVTIHLIKSFSEDIQVWLRTTSTSRTLTYISTVLSSAQLSPRLVLIFYWKIYLIFYLLKLCASLPSLINNPDWNFPGKQTNIYIKLFSSSSSPSPSPGLLPPCLCLPRIL